MSTKLQVENTDLMFNNLMVHLSTAVTPGALKITQSSKKTAVIETTTVFF